MLTNMQPWVDIRLRGEKTRLLQNYTCSLLVSFTIQSSRDTQNSVQARF